MAVEIEKNKNGIVGELMNVGAHFGYASARRHPSVKSFILGSKNKVEIFDLEKTAEKLADAEQAMEALGAEGKVVLFVTSKGEAREVVKNAAESIDMPYVAGRWIGGTITNFEQIHKRLQKLIDLNDQKEKGQLGKYTKKERLMIDREIEKLTLMFSGIISLKKNPDAVFVVDSKQEYIAVAEANQNHIPVFALASSDCDISLVQHAVPANDSAQKTIELVTKKLVAAYQEGKKKAPVKTESEKKGTKKEVK